MYIVNIHRFTVNIEMSVPVFQKIVQASYDNNQTLQVDKYGYRDLLNSTCKPYF